MKTCVEMIEEGRVKDILEDALSDSVEKLEKSMPISATQFQRGRVDGLRFALKVLGWVEDAQKEKVLKREKEV